MLLPTTTVPVISLLPRIYIPRATQLEISFKTISVSVSTASNAVERLSLIVTVCYPDSSLPRENSHDTQLKGDGGFFFPCSMSCD